PGQNAPKTGHNWWAECDQCGRVELTPIGRQELISCGCYAAHSPQGLERHIPGFYSERLLEAYRRARQARFEYGERG
ncbi:MAG: hypothetical protein M3506_09450, partial [Chloroflexota bacterium]|nr:hypothetical protein [Chloroflexota bacterium]